MRENGYYWVSGTCHYRESGENAKAYIVELRDDVVYECGSDSWNDVSNVVFRSERLTLQNAPLRQDIGKPVYVIVDDRRMMDDSYGRWVWNGKAMSRIHASAIEVGKGYQSAVTARKTLSRLIRCGRLVGDAELYAVYPNGDITRIEASSF
mgnify:CR=1 FL=1